MQDPDRLPPEERLAEVHTASLGRRVRFWLVKRMLRGDLCVANAIMVTPPGWMLLRRDFTQEGPVVNNAFYMNPLADPVPGSVVMGRGDEEAQ